MGAPAPDSAVIPIEPLPFLIGRSQGCQLCIAHHEVSRRHALVHSDGDYYYLEDLDSRNGSYINDKRIQAGERRRLVHDDLIQIANTAILHFIDFEATQRSDFILPIGHPGLWLDVEGHSAFLRTARVPLTPLQFRLLELLYAHLGAPVARAEIARILWETDAGLTDTMIDNTVSRLRSVLLKLDPGHEYIVTVRGYGYRFVQRA